MKSTQLHSSTSLKCITEKEKLIKQGIKKEIKRCKQLYNSNMLNAKLSILYFHNINYLKYMRGLFRTPMCVND